MRIINVWLAVSDAAQAEIRTALQDEEYSGPLTKREVAVFRYMQQEVERRRLFKKPTLSGTVYNLWSLDFDRDVDPVSAIKNTLDGLIAKYPNQIAIVGVWKRDGAMLGTTLVLTDVPNPAYTGEPFMIPNPGYQPDPELEDYDPRTEVRNPAWVPETITERSQTGTPTYPLPNYLWRFMPDDADGNPTATSNADLRDVNLLAGQQFRVFN
jgi:hypothetical protein